MAFGKNPHVAKAQAAEQKAHDAADEPARQQAWLEAGRHWDRASEREKNASRKQEYTDNAEAARANVE
jgi:hypothetical protein